MCFCGVNKAKKGSFFKDEYDAHRATFVLRFCKKKKKKRESVASENSHKVQQKKKKTTPLNTRLR